MYKNRHCWQSCSCTFGLGAILGVPKNGLIYVEADTKKLYAVILKNFMQLCYGITNSSMPVTLNCTIVAPVTIKRPRKWIYSCEGRPKRCQVILKAEKCVLYGNHNASKIWLYKLLPASPFSSAKWKYFKMELDVDPRRDDDASPTSTEGMKAQLFSRFKLYNFFYVHSCWRDKNQFNKAA